MASHILAIDQGTTSSRAIVFDAQLRIVGARRSRNSASIFPKPGWVEHDPEEIWETRRRDLPRGDPQGRRQAAPTSPPSASPTSARRRSSGTARPASRSTAPSSGRTAAPPTLARRSARPAIEAEVAARTGLLLDPYFSGTKIAWLLDHVKGARDKAERGELAFGTIDSFLIWRLTGGKVHATDATNASRTLLFNIHDGRVGRRRCSASSTCPRMLCPRSGTAPPTTASTDQAILGAAIPILGVAGDQQAATVGQACFEPGMLKSTYGTGCFALLNTGDQAGDVAQPPAHHHRLPARAASAPMRSKARSSSPAPPCSGSATASASSATPPTRQALAKQADPRPARSISCRPSSGSARRYWDAEARGAILRHHPRHDAAEIARAALESVGYQTRDLLEAMRGDWDGAARRQHGAPRRRRHGRLGLDHAVPRRHPRRAGRPAEDPGDDGARRRLSRRPPGRALPAAAPISPRRGSASAASSRRCARRSAPPLAGWRDAVSGPQPAHTQCQEKHVLDCDRGW